MGRIIRVAIRIFEHAWGLIAIFAFWQIWVMANHYNSIVIVSPLSVLRDMVLNPMIYLRPSLWTLAFGLGGLTAGMSIGLLLAVTAWRWRLFAGTIGPAALLISSTPVVCLIPLLARIFGYESRTEFVTVTVMSFFPCFVFATAGLRALPPMSRELFQVLAASRSRQLLSLALPAAVPSLAVALRVGAATSVLVTMVAEYLMQTGGLGNMFALTSQAFQTERAWGASLAAMALSAILYTIGGAVEIRVHERYK
ncbi:ABC transporter permease [Granulicella aggregans]|uniref:ABC transporter permease n=1 Tax=Granulicella aggregans TaxID=474949 RepID=UPI0021DFE0C4|nr:ABC transporter permease subunit [Granulicella aggregans]